MRLTIFNGSGRGNGGNTAILVEEIQQGFTSIEGCTCEMYTLMQSEKMEQFTDAFARAELILMTFPMYTDTVPGIVKTFIESLEPLCGRPDNPPIAFMIHCGFPEALQLRTLERYLIKLSQRLGCRYLGTIMKGNSEGIRSTPAEKRPNLTIKMQHLGRILAQTGELDGAVLQQLAQPERLSPWVRLLFRILGLTPLVNLGWNQELKQNGVYKQRSARPYTDG